MASSTIDLLFADASSLVLQSFLAPQWGIYLNGVAVIEPATSIVSQLAAAAGPLREIAAAVGFANIVPVSASTVEFEFAQEWPISTYPQENGAFQAYDKVTLPFDIKFKLACGGPTSTRQAFLGTCLGIANSLALFDIVTPEIIFPSCNCIHIDWPRKADSGVSLIKVDLWFKQVPVTSVNSYSSTREPGEAGQQGLGNVQSVSPTLTFAERFSGGVVQ